MFTSFYVCFVYGNQVYLCESFEYDVQDEL